MIGTIIVVLNQRDFALMQARLFDKVHVRWVNSVSRHNHTDHNCEFAQFSDTRLPEDADQQIILLHQPDVKKDNFVPLKGAMAILHEFQDRMADRPFYIGYLSLLNSQGTILNIFEPQVEAQKSIK